MSIAIKRNFKVYQTSIGTSTLYVASSIASSSTISGALVVNGGIGLSENISVGNKIQLFNGNLYTGLISSAIANTTYVLPNSTPSTGGSVLSSDESGLMSWIPMTASSPGGNLTLNGLTASTQYLSTTISGLGFTISSIGSTHTFFLGSAGYASTGVVTSNDQILFGIKTFGSGIAITTKTGSGSTTTGALIVSGGVGIGGSLNVHLPSSFDDDINLNFSKNIKFFNINNSYYTAFKSGLSTTSVIYTLPLSDGSPNQVLYTNGSASLGWTTTASSSGITSLNALSDTVQLLATSLSGSGFTIGSLSNTHTFYLGLAGNGSTGLVSSTTQSIYGSKTFVNDLKVTSTTLSTSSASGALTITGGLGVSGNVYIGGNLALIQSTEKYHSYTSNIGSGTAVTISASSLGGIVYINTGTVSGNWVLDITGLGITNGYSSSITVIVSQGATAYIPTTFRISGFGQTINWQGNVVPTGNSNKKDVIAFSILSTGIGNSDYLVFGQLVSFG